MQYYKAYLFTTFVIYEVTHALKKSAVDFYKWIEKMASIDTDGEIQDLITCSICLTEFDQDEHSPKFLPCGHTLCSSCLKVN
jgi:hypothetical protein